MVKGLTRVSEAKFQDDGDVSVAFLEGRILGELDLLDKFKVAVRVARRDNLETGFDLRLHLAIRSLV